ncbi:unnamed protein product, partial [Staurois parvus]
PRSLLGPVTCCSRSDLPIKEWHLWGARGREYPNLTGTRSHFCCDRLGDRKRKLSSPPPSP